jgi:hypothetical protein
VLSGLGELERRELLTWVGEHLPEVRRTAVGQRPVYWILGLGFVLGMAAYVGGYALRSSVTTEPLRFVGDLLYTLGWALWTGVVVVVFLQVLPEAKRRQYKQALDTYEAALRDKARAEGDGYRGTTKRQQVLDPQLCGHAVDRRDNEGSRGPLDRLARHAARAPDARWRDVQADPGGEVREAARARLSASRTRGDGT